MKNSKFSFELFLEIGNFGLSKQQKDDILANFVNQIIATREDYEILYIADRTNWIPGCLTKFERGFEDFTSNFFDKLTSLRRDSQTVLSR